MFAALLVVTLSVAAQACDIADPTCGPLVHPNAGLKVACNNVDDPKCEPALVPPSNDFQPVGDFGPSGQSELVC